MGMMINRRRVCGGNNVPPYLKGYTLIHHWEADDWAVGTDWVDRVGGLVFQRYDNPIKQDGLIAVCCGKGYFQLDANKNAPYGINMGSLWVVEIEGMVEDNSLTTSQVQAVADFGSFNGANHAFAPFNVDSSCRMSFNPKFTGNSSFSLYNQTFDFTPYYGKLVKCTIGTKEVDNNTVLPFYVLEGEIKYSPNTLTQRQAMFNRNFSQPMLTVGRTNIMNNNFDNINDYKYIKSIKIYTKYQ